VSGLAWDLPNYLGGGSCYAFNTTFTQANAASLCSGTIPGVPGPSGFASRLPTQAELTALLAMQAPSTCSGFDGDPALQAVMKASYYWTSTPGGAGFVAVSFADGTISTAQTKAYFICVK
jgi:hypothetical protein